MNRVSIQGAEPLQCGTLVLRMNLPTALLGLIGNRRCGRKIGLRLERLPVEYTDVTDQEVCAIGFRQTYGEVEIAIVRKGQCQIGDS